MPIPRVICQGQLVSVTMKALGCEAGNYIGAAAFADTKNSLHNPEISTAAASDIVIDDRNGNFLPDEYVNNNYDNFVL